ncbi:MAG: YdeI/OmpD-associated family protein [Pseudomonadota bacterium]
MSGDDDGDVGALVKPDDLIEVLAAQPLAMEHFDAFPRSSQRGILGWIKVSENSGDTFQACSGSGTVGCQNITANHPASKRNR